MSNFTTAKKWSWSVGSLLGVSHDLNNLLTVVSSNLDMIEHVAKSDKVGQFATAARRAIDLSAKLTSQLLSFSRRQKMNPMLTNVNQLISEFQGLMRQALGRGCDVKLRIDHQLWRCRVDPSLLKAALLNLVLNGRDAMPQGGSLELETLQRHPACAMRGRTPNKIFCPSVGGGHRLRNSGRGA